MSNVVVMTNNDDDDERDEDDEENDDDDNHIERDEQHTLFSLSFSLFRRFQNKTFVEQCGANNKNNTSVSVRLDDSNV